ncbi:MAG: RIP metalloprotease RseP [Dongiaceae bacterium]
MDLLLGAPHYIIATLVLLTIVVFFHELGHFWVARRCGVQVDVFSVGFGRELFGFTDRKGTRWKFSAIPLGGYVKMKGQSDTEGVETPDPAAVSAEDRATSFHFKPLWQKAAIVFAGPAANYVLAVIVLAVVFATLGKQYFPPVVGVVEQEGAAAKAGLRTGDRILSVAGYEVDEYNAIFLALQVDVSEIVDIVIKRGGETLTLQAKPDLTSQTGWLGNVDTFRDLKFTPFVAPIIGEINKGSGAEKAGLKSGDRILSLAGQPIGDFAEISGIVQKSKGAPVDLIVERDNQRLTISATPAVEEITSAAGAKESRFILGIGPADSREAHRLGLLTAVRIAVEDTVRTTGFILTTVGQMISGKRSSDEIGGVLRIGKIAGDTAQGTVREFLMLVAMISINLGLINLFPVPLLDGGHLAFYAVEAVRGRPLSQRVQDFALKIGLAAVVSLMLFAMWNDLKYLRVIEFLKNLVS